MCITESEQTGQPAAYGSAVKLRYSELTQELADLLVRVIGRPAIAMADLEGEPTESADRDYLWSLQFTIAAGTSQIQRNLIAQRVLGLPRE